MGDGRFARAKTRTILYDGWDFRSTSKFTFSGCYEKIHIIHIFFDCSTKFNLLSVTRGSIIVTQIEVTEKI